MDIAEKKSLAAALRRDLNRPLVLVGMMGSGKTSLGRALAAALGVGFYDSDLLVEERAGCGVQEFFERYGEDEFRVAEKRVILDLLEKGPCVIATGGGAFASEETLAAIKRRGVSVWLDAPVSVLAERVKAGRRSDRPLLKNKDVDAVLEALLEERRAYYRQADIRIENAGACIEDALETLIKMLSATLNKGNE